MSREPINAIGPANLLRLKAGPYAIENAASKVELRMPDSPEDHGCSRR